MTTTNAYKPDMATRIAQARAAQHQPPLIALVSKVPADYTAARDRSELREKR